MNDCFYLALESVLKELSDLKSVRNTVLLAIDGRCASGKTTLAKKLSDRLCCDVIHIDDFFLKANQRTEQRLNEIGGNFDCERFLCEAMAPLLKGEEFSYKRYDCSSDSFTESVHIHPGDVTIIEGAYSCHPALWSSYDLRVFLTVNRDEQIRRILKRNGASALKAFEEKWIPYEERYFKEQDIENRCDLRFCIE